VNSDVLAALWGAAAALSWGTGDFSGGLGARRVSSLSVTLISNPLGLAFLIVLALIRFSPPPLLHDAILGVLVGAFGAFGIFLLYRALASGKMGIAAPITAVLANAVSVLVSAATEGVPGPLKWLGFIIAGVGVWLISRPEGESGAKGFPKELIPAVLSGLAFGIFFSLSAQFTKDADVSWSLVIARLTATLLFFAAAIQQRAVKIECSVFGFAALAGVCDSLGNVFFAFAGQAGRLDISAVSSSLYPVVTVALAVLVLRERLTWVQGVGALLAFGAVALIVVA
jgi:drug/metabolite transporter (DMT)-like permease